MRLEFYLDNELIFDAASDCVPPPGAEAAFVVKYGAPRYPRGWEIRAKILAQKDPVYVFGDNPYVTIVSNIEVISSAMPRDE